MIITTKRHNEILETQRADFQTQVNEINARHEVSLRTALDVKELLTAFGSKLTSFCTLGSCNFSGGFTLSDDVPQYVEDFFGGKVIKQEATKVIHITPDGSVQTGLTRRPPEEGFTYILRRD